MRVRYVALLFFSSVLAWSAVPLVSHAAAVTIYSQPDASGEMVSQQATFQNAWIASASLGNLFLGKDRLSITFTMKDPNASTLYHSPFGGVALETCPTCLDLQKYYFTDADRAILSDGAFHTFTVQTGTTTLGTADGETPIYIEFFSLSQYYHGTHLKSNASGTIPYLSIEAASLPVPPPVPQAPPGSVTIYEQSDKTGVMTNPQQTALNSYIDSASLGNLPLGQEKLYLTFTMKDPHTSSAYTLPQGVCIEPAGILDCGTRLQTYYFTKEDRAMLADGAFHTFMVETGTTTSTYADGTRPVAIGFFGLMQYQYGTKIKSNAAATIPFLKIQKLPPPDPCAAGGCISNVLFLPGIEGSRLYYRGALGVEHQVWEPDYRTDIPYLAMNADGTSKYPLYTRDIIGAMQEHNPLWNTIAGMFGTNLETYRGFEDFMDTLVASSTFGLREWRAYPYDWRYDVRDIITQGTPTAMPDGTVRQVYLEQMVKEMASSSASHKVTIVAHSNGGLLAKALAEKLGAEASQYIDRIIMVGTPQWGTPMAAGALLHADNFSDVPSLIMKSAEVRSVTSGMNGPYGLLPSPAYFSHVSDPVAMFAAGGLLSGKYATSFGEALNSFSSLANFLTDAAGLNAQMGTATDLRVPLALSSVLVNKGAATHGVLDAWTPPANVALTAIAGWGQDTVKTLAYSTGSKVVCTNSTFSSYSVCADSPTLLHTPVTTQDGDGTVVSPSAVGNVGNGLYFNALDFVHNEKENIEHRNLTSARPIQDVISSLLQRGDIGAGQYIAPSKPPNEANPIKLRISSHSPVNLVMTDASGNQSGVLPIPGTDFSGIKRDISGSSVQVFDDEEYISVPGSGSYQVTASGYATGSATLAVETIGSSGESNATATFADIPVAGDSTTAFSVTDGSVSAPAVDVNGDGTTDFTAASSSAGADPLAYMSYMKAIVGTMPLSNGKKNELMGRLSEIERQLAKQKSPARLQLDILKRYVEQQVALSTRLPAQGIPGAQAEIILGMITKLKALL